MNSDLDFGREFSIEVAENGANGETVFAICIETDDDNLLIPMKVYQVQRRDDSLLVRDESGEAAIYPARFFMQLKLPPALESALTQVIL